ncbi:TetR family transcriptional regulator [Paraburkholderia nemoris]|uniref:TetR/AcrR family transcriptional regulator n=1 Tax=Paraburkholderia nemoris TaxID=2793076 RepID=UPI0038BDFB34
MNDNAPSTSTGKPETPKRRRKNRAAGRPEQTATVGSETILSAVIDLLKTRAPDSLTLLDVAKHASVDPALIRYYFGNQDGLYTAAASKLMAERQEAHRSLMALQGSVDARLKRRVLTAIEQQVENPNFHRLVVERLFEAETVEGKEALEKTAARGLALTVSFLHAHGADTELRGVDPRFLNIAIIGMCEFFVSARTLVEALCGQEVDDTLINSYAEFIVDVLLNGLRRCVAPAISPETPNDPGLSA